MQILEYCKFCSKKPYESLGMKLSRNGEGYIVISVINGVENIKTCPVCRGFGYRVVEEVEVPKDYFDKTFYIED